MVTINPITCITGDEQERWLAEGNQDYLYGFVFSDDVVDPLEIKLKETTEYHMSIHPSDYPYEYVKEHCDRFFGGEFVTCDSSLFQYYLQHYTESQTQFYTEGDPKLSWFILLDEDGEVAALIEGPRY